MSIFDKQLSRKPDLYPWTKDFVSVMWKGFWTPDEFDFSPDKQDFAVNMTEEEKQIVLKTVSAISQVEVAVKSFWSDIGKKLPHPSIANLGHYFGGVEVVHGEAYDRLLEALDMEDQYDKNLQEPVFKARVDYLSKYSERMFEDDKKQILYSLILFTLFTENVSLFSQFYIILYLQNYKNILKHTAQQIRYTTKEEQVHAYAGIALINQIRKEFPELFDKELEELVRRKADTAITAESNLIDWIMGDYSHEYVNNEEGVHSELSAEILQCFIADRMNTSLNMIGFDPLYVFAEDNTLYKTEWMNKEITSGVQTDFFNSRPVDYTRNDREFDAEDWF